jgi:hypothetical protein
VVHIHQCASQEGEDKQLRVPRDGRGDQKCHKAVHARVDQCLERTPEEGTTPDQVVGDEQQREKHHSAKHNASDATQVVRERTFTFRASSTLASELTRPLVDQLISPNNPER